MSKFSIFIQTRKVAAVVSRNW